MGVVCGGAAMACHGCTLCFQVIAKSWEWMARPLLRRMLPLRLLEYNPLPLRDLNVSGTMPTSDRGSSGNLGQRCLGVQLIQHVGLVMDHQLMLSVLVDYESAVAYGTPRTAILVMGRREPRSSLKHHDRDPVGKFQCAGSKMSSTV